MKPLPIILFPLVLFANSANIVFGQQGKALELPVNETVAAKIKALKPNEAVLLGEAKVVGDFNEVTKRGN